MAKTLHQQGANIVLHYRNSKTTAQALQTELNAERSDSAFLVQGDLLDTATIGHIVEQTLKQAMHKNLRRALRR